MKTVTSKNIKLSRVTVSDPNCDAFSDRIELLISRIGGNSEFARKCGVSEGTVRSWRKCESDPSRKRLITIAEAFDVSLVWLATGEGEMYPEPAPNPLPKRRIDDVEAYRDEVWQDFALVPVLDVQASAGHGSNVELELKTGQLAFRKKWLREKSLNIEHLAIITAKGDSMEPTIRDGCILLIDRHIDTIIDDAIYIIQTDHHLIVKRVQQDLDGSLHIISDNKIYKEQLIPKEQAKEVKIAGRVIWFGHEI